MVALIEAKSTELIQLCQRYDVQRLELFGSATRDDFDPQDSDLDFLVVFPDMDPVTYADAYFGLLSALHDLFERPVELVVLSAIKNPYFLQKINQDRMLLYAA